MRSANNYCIGSYLENCKTNRCSPGLGDFIRGCLAMMKLCEKYNYNFYIDKDSHEMFSYIQKSEIFIDNNFFIDNNCQELRKHENILELIPPMGYDSINNQLEHLFYSKQNFNIITNAFINFPVVWGNINDYQYNILNKMLTPNQELQNEITIMFKALGVEKHNYNILHIRTGDQLIRNDRIEQTLVDDIKKIINTNNLILEETIIVSDSTKIAYELQKYNNLLKYYPTKKIHLGERVLKDNENKKEHIKETLLDFFLISYSKNVTAIPGSGFSRAASIYGKNNYKEYNYNIHNNFLFA